MKKFLGILIVATFLITGCNQIGSIIEPLIGTWSMTILGIETSTTLNANGVATETNSLGELGISKSGTWSSDSGILTVVWADETPVNYSYFFNADKTELTLTPLPSGLALTYTRE